MKIKSIKEGLLIPKEELADLGEVEVIRKGSIIFIKPINMTSRTRGRIKSPLDVEEIAASYTNIPISRMGEF